MCSNLQGIGWGGFLERRSVNKTIYSDQKTPNEFDYLYLWRLTFLGFQCRYQFVHGLTSVIVNSFKRCTDCRLLVYLKMKGKADHSKKYR